jgi:hypothetical protein
MRGTDKLAAGMLLVLTLAGSVSLATGPVGADDASPVRVQMVVCLDGSGSMDNAEWALMVGGLAEAVTDPTTISMNGSLELGVNKFGYMSTTGGVRAEVVVPMTVIDSQAAADGVASLVAATAKPGGWTPTSRAIELAAAMMKASAHWSQASRRIINISTDGEPAGDPDEVSPYPESQQRAVEARNTVISADGDGFRVTEIHAEMIGTSPAAIEWMRTNILYPQPGVIVDSPTDPYPDPRLNGFAVVVSTFDDYEQAIRQKFEITFPRQLILTPPESLKALGDSHTVTVTLLDGSGSPVADTSVRFEITGGPHQGQGGSTTTDASGEASWSYAGTGTGQDTVVATTDTLVSNEVTITWQAASALSSRSVPALPSVPLGIVGAMMAAVLAYLVRGKLI